LGVEIGYDLIVYELFYYSLSIGQILLNDRIRGCTSNMHEGYGKCVQYFSFYLTIFLSAAHNGRMIMDWAGHGRM
jgi:hypothetical protein